MSETTLASLIADQWVAGDGQSVALPDASTGQVVANISTAGLDFSAAVNHARRVGGPALRELTFHQRAALLRAVGKHLLDESVKPDLYELSACTGATKTDSWIDIDGGAGVLLTYASRARKELPNHTLMVDGPVEPLSRDGSFAAVHALTSRHGLELQINAYNFPVWGMLEKLAPALLAGVPTIVKPASQTAYLAQAVVRSIHQAGLLPDGALQLIAGSCPGLLDLLDGQDSVAFTGSADTAHQLRSHPGVVAGSVRFNAEADSVNTAILASDAAPGTAEFDLFVSEVVKEITVKAGQKCTAIRRAFVPRAHLDAATDAISAALGSIVVGDPRDESVSMGPLVSRSQADSVSNAVAQLAADASTVSNASQLTGDTALGGFMAPTLLRADDPSPQALHQVEAFGPVATLMPYESHEQACQLARAGGGSLVASVYSADPAHVTTLVTGIASHHGRVLVMDESVAKSSTGHGSPLPQLVHGGPGRAGGGQEMGGMRAVHAHLQRTAIQGSVDMLTAVSAEYVPGSATRVDKGHPFRLTFDDLAVGDSIKTDSRVVTREDIDLFAQTTGDTFYAHTDEQAAQRSPIFGGIVAHGYLVLSFAAGLFVSPEEGPVLANYGIDRLRFATPTRPGDEIHVVLTCKRKTQLDGRGYGEVAWDTRVINQNGEVAAAYDVLTMVANRPGVNGAPAD